MWETLQAWPILPAVALGTVIDHSGLPLFLLLAVSAAPKLETAVWQIALCATAGAFAGDLVFLAIGRAAGKQFFLAGNLVRLMGRLPETLIDAVGRRPVLALTLYRYIPAVGKYAPLAAGAAGTPILKGSLLCAAGSIVYCAAFTLLGWLVQPILVDDIVGARGTWGPIVGGTALLVVLVLGVRASRASRRAASERER